MPTDPASPTWRTRYAALAAALVIGGLCQAYIIARSPIIAKDGIGFIRIAKSLAGDPVTTLRIEDQHPGYPALVLAFERGWQAMTGHDEFQSFIIASRLVSATCGLLTIVFLWLFARRLYDERIANVTVLIAAVWPLFRLNACDSLSDTPHLMLYLAGAWLAAEGLTSRRVLWFAAAGLASGLAFWVRPEGLVVSAAAGLLLAIEFCRPRLLQRPTAALALIGLSIATLLVVAPYVAVAGKFTSKKLPSFHQPQQTSAHAVAVASVEPTAGLLGEPGPGGTLPDEFRRPSKFMGVVAFGLFELARELAQGFYYLAIIPLAAGTFAPRPHRPSRSTGLFHILLMSGHAALLMLLYLTAGYISHRHVMPLIALMLPTAAAGAAWLADEAARWLGQSLSDAPASKGESRKSKVQSRESGARSQGSGVCNLPLSTSYRLPSTVYQLPGHRVRFAASRRALLKWLAGTPQRALVIAVCIFYVGLVPKCLRPLHGVYLPVLEAAQWVKAQAKPGDSVLSTSGYVRFYAGLPGILVGAEAPNLPLGLYFAPNKRWSFIVLEVDQRSFDREALCGSTGQYEEVMELPAHPRKPWAKVAVFRARSSGQADSPHIATSVKADGKR
jgi:4-amino-4-deoxy-L-arabinose transferase-like glycosyltransferase